MKFEIKKANGTTLTKEVNSNDKNYINKLKKIGWKEVSTTSKSKSKKKK